MADLIMKQGEAFSTTLTIKDKDGSTIDVTAGTLTFRAKKSDSDSTYSLEIEDASFSSKGDGSAVMAVSAVKSAAMEAGRHTGELKVAISSNVYISQDINIAVSASYF